MGAGVVVFGAATVVVGAAVVVVGHSSDGGNDAESVESKVRSLFRIVSVTVPLEGAAPMACQICRGPVPSCRSDRRQCRWYRESSTTLTKWSGVTLALSVTVRFQT